MPPVTRLNPQITVNFQDFFFSVSAQKSPISEQMWNQWLQQWLTISAEDLPPAPTYELSLRLTTDSEIQQLNAQYRAKNQPTDVLAFAALEVNSPALPAEFLAAEPLYLGDIIISVDTAKKQAQQQNHTLTRELAWLAAHGLLHLLGWDHPDAESLNQMLAQQEKFLAKISL